MSLDFRRVIQYRCSDLNRQHQSREGVIHRACWRFCQRTKLPLQAGWEGQPKWEERRDALWRRRMKPDDAYREGYDRGRNDSLGGRLAEITMGMLRADPGGYFAAGYYDGAGGRKFSVRGLKESKPRSHKSSATSAISLPSPLESQWYRFCDESEFIPKVTVDQCLATLYAAGSQVAAINRPVRLGRLHENRLLYWPSNSPGLPHRHPRRRSHA